MTKKEMLIVLKMYKTQLDYIGVALDGMRQSIDFIELAVNGMRENIKELTKTLEQETGEGASE